MAAALHWLVACAGSAPPSAADHACFRALDCAEGLVCVEGRCTSDVSPIAGNVSAAAPPAGAAAAPQNGAAALAPGSSSSPDAGATP